MEVIYKKQGRYPYYRATVFMDENYEDPDLASWFEWFKKKNIPCCIAMGHDIKYYGRLAVWVRDEEHVFPGEMNNSEKVGRIVESYNWDEGSKVLRRWQIDNNDGVECIEMEGSCH